MVTAACIISEPESFPKLHEATVTLLAKYVFVLGHRSLDLIQALLITAVWCMPPDNIANINIFQLTQAAGAMTVELGLIGRTSKQAQRQDIDQLNGPLSDQMMERVRTCLATYLTCSRYVSSCTWELYPNIMKECCELPSTDRGFPPPFYHDSDGRVLSECYNTRGSQIIGMATLAEYCRRY